MSTSQLRSFRTPARTPFEKKRIQEVQEMFRYKLNPLHVTLYEGGGMYRFTYLDIASYFEQKAVAYTLTSSCFEWEVEEGEAQRKSLAQPIR